MTTTMTINANKAKELTHEALAKMAYYRDCKIAECLKEMEPLIEKTAQSGCSQKVFKFEFCEKFCDDITYAVIHLLRANGFEVEIEKATRVFCVRW